jgi:RNA polymerase sigma-70 factor (ECF subfamily)
MNDNHRPSDSDHVSGRACSDDGEGSQAGDADQLGNSLSDQELIARINGGSHEAFSILYFRYRDWVTRLAYRFTGHHDDALDVLQETFAYVVRKFPGFELTAAMTTFLYPAVRNLSIAARKKRRRNTSSSEADGHLSALEGTSDAVPDGELSEVLQSIGETHREILLMRFVDDMTQPEIAAALDLPLGTVKSRLHHAIRSVKQNPYVMEHLQELNP